MKALGATLATLMFLLAVSAAAEHASVEGEVVVQFAKGIDLAASEAVLRQHGCRAKESIGARGIVLAALPGGIDPSSAARDLASEPACLFAHPNYIGRGGDVTPDDTWFWQQWHHNNAGQTGGLVDADLDAPEGWEITRGSSQIVVAVLDTGIDSDHPDFAGRFLSGYDFVNEDSDPEADHPHGALVSGLLAATADNDFSVAGVDHLCTILPVKVLDEFNFGTTFDFIQGLYYSAEQEADVVSMSLINYPGTQALIDAIAAARDAGCVLIACGGNDGIGDADISWPGASPQTISIGWTGHSDTRHPLSGTGDALDLVAPGWNVATVAFDTPDDDYSFFSGCSAATPVAAGVASLCLALDPSMTHDQIKNALIVGAEDEVGPAGQDTPGWDPYFGYGRLNLNGTLQGVLTSSAPHVGPGLAAGRTIAVDPNPMTSETTLRLDSVSGGPVVVAIYGADGRRVRTLRAPGGATEPSILWDGRDGRGVPVSPGAYFARAGGFPGYGGKILVVR